MMGHLLLIFCIFVLILPPLIFSLPVPETASPEENILNEATSTANSSEAEAIITAEAITIDGNTTANISAELLTSTGQAKSEEEEYDEEEHEEEITVAPTTTRKRRKVPRKRTSPKLNITTSRPTRGKPARKRTTVKAKVVENADEITSDGTDDIELSMKNLFETPEEHVDFRYAVIIDAGSSHTDLVIYEWHVNKINGSGVVREKLDKECTGPLSNFRDNPEAAGPSLRECLQHASLEIPISQHSSTKVLLGATAGMRVLRENDAVAADRILQSVISFIRKEFSFNVSEENIKILSPELEGGFSWIAINYIKKILPDNAKLPTASRLPTWGSLDLGGASTQFTNEITPSTTKKIRATFKINLYGHEYHVYTRSYLCYGKNEAHRRYKAILLNHKNFSEPIIDPCRPVGYETTIESTQHFGRPCSNGSIPNHRHREKFAIRGSGDAEGCRQLVLELFQKNMDLSPSVCPFADGECTFRGIEKGKVQGKFVGSGALFYDTKNLRVISNESFSLDPFDFSGFRAARQAVCNKTHDEVERWIEKRPELKNFFIRQCFDTTYLEVLLGEVYNLSDEVLSNTTFAKKIDGINVGWTLGWAVAASSDLPNSGYEALYLYNRG